MFMRPHVSWLRDRMLLLLDRSIPWPVRLALALLALEQSRLL